MIRARRLSFGYGRPLLVDVDLDVARGELVGILGANGAGKSTLARLLLGLAAPATGDVAIDGHDLATLSPRARARLVAAVLQDEPLEFPFTALEPLTAHASLPAVKMKRVHTVDGDLLFRPGPRLVDGIELLARLFHP